MSFPPGIHDVVVLHSDLHVARLGIQYHHLIGHEKQFAFILFGERTMHSYGDFGYKKSFFVVVVFFC